MPAVLGLTNQPHNGSMGGGGGGGGGAPKHNSQPKQKQQPAKPGTSNNKMASGPSGNKNRLDTISKRNHAAAREVETLLWRALCDSPEAAKEYMALDCVMINPLFSGSNEPMSKDTEPSIEKVLEGCEPWQSFRFHGDPLVAEIDLMAVALVYKISLYRLGRKGGLKEVVATCSSSWRQTAGADWLLCAQHVQYADEDGE